MAQFNNKMAAIISSFQKNWSGIIRDLVVGIVVAWMAYNWATKNQEKTDLINKVDAKLDIIDFKSHEKENDRAFRGMITTASESTKEINQLLRQILEQQAKTSTDIEWIKKRVK